MAASLSDQYDDLGRSSRADCRRLGGGCISVWGEFLDPLRQYIGTTETPGLYKIVDGENIFQGGFYALESILMVDGESAPRYLAYYLEGPQADCQLSPIIDGTWPNLAVSDETYTESFTNHTLCLIGLPNPG